jgi:hypothetical protein
LGRDANGGFDLLGGGGLGDLNGGFLFFCERRELIDFDGVGMDDAEIEPVGRESEVLTGAFDRRALDLEELVAAVGLVDDDGLGGELFRLDVVSVEDGRGGHDAAEGEASAGRSEGEVGVDVLAEEALLPHLLAAHIEGADDPGGLAATAAEGDEFTVTDEDGVGTAGGVEGREFEGFAGEGVEVEGPALVALIDDVEMAGGGEDDLAEGSRATCASAANVDFVAGAGGDGETIEVDLHGRRIAGRGRVRGGGWMRGRPEERRPRRFCGGCGFLFRFGFDDEHVGVGGEEEESDVAVERGEEGALGEGCGRGEVGERGDGGEGVADAEEEASVTEGPEVLAVVVESPLGACEDAAGGEFEEEGGNVAVLVGGRVVGDALEEGAGVVGEQEVCVVDEVEGEHGTAGEEELRNERLETEWGKRDAEGWLRIASEAGGGGEEKEQGEAQEPAEAAERSGLEGNRHGWGRVSVLVQIVNRLLFHRRDSDAKVCRLRLAIRDSLR